jgi:hypothetical protein
VRCPICRKLIKNIESGDRLPLNINILFEIVEKDTKLAECTFDFDDEDEDEMTEKFCSDH